MKRLRICQAFGLLTLFFAHTVMAQGPDEGPAPPPPAAPINEWVPIMFILAVVFVYFFLQKQNDKSILKTNYNERKK